ncbi:MAG: hypothetical protein AB8G17_19655 [Gammaproteobacteria bacterium]
MGYVDSYLVQVGRHLTNAQRDDILDELRSSIEDQVHDIAGDREPTPDDEKAVIARLGHPLKVASGYTGPRYLIGPELFPSFVQTLQRVLVIVALVQVAVLAVAFVSSGYTTTLRGLFSGAFGTLMWALVIVLGVFAAVEYSGDQLNWYNNWTPDSLSLARVTPIDRGDLITNLVSEVVFLLWWNDILVLQNWIPGNGEVLAFALGPAWSALHLPLNVVFGGWFLLHLAVLLRGVWSPKTLALEIALGVVGLVIAGWLLLQPPLLIVSGALGDHTEQLTERVVFATIVIIAASILWDIWLAYRRLRKTSVA